MDAPGAPPPPPAAASAARTRLRVRRGGETYVVEVNTSDLPKFRRLKRSKDDEATAAARRNLHRDSTSRVLPPALERRLPRHWTRPWPDYDEEEHDEDHSHHKRARVPAKSKVPYEGVTPAEPGLQGECAVCLEDFKAKDVLREMPCSHTFHRDCLGLWLQTKPVCPICRRALPARQPQLSMLVPDAYGLAVPTGI